MEETTVTIIGMFIAIIIMLIVPLMLIADRADDISQLVVQTVTAEFVDDIIKTGQITNERYEQFVNGLNSSGNLYDINIEIKILDENTAKKTTDASREIGKNTYYSIFTSQIEEKIATNGKINLKQGDGISVIVKNSSATLSQTLKSFYYTARGLDIHIIAGASSGTIAIDGKT